MPGCSSRIQRAYRVQALKGLGTEKGLQHVGLEGAKGSRMRVGLRVVWVLRDQQRCFTCRGASPISNLTNPPSVQAKTLPTEHVFGDVWVIPKIGICKIRPQLLSSFFYGPPFTLQKGSI